MTDTERRKAAKEFSERWTKKLDDRENDPVNGSDEVALCQPFWMDLIQSLFDIEHPMDVLTFNKPIKDADDPYTVQKNGAIDVYVPSTKIIIEQKGSKKDLSKKYPQSDGTMLTPYRQADRYDDALPQSEKARWIITSNFREIRIYDMDTMPRGTVHETIRLEDLAENAHRLQFLVNATKTFVPKETEISIEAGEIVANLYDRLLHLYKEKDSAESKESLNILSVRLVFCMYAEDAEIFDKLQFHDYVEHFSADELGEALDRLFQVLDTPAEKRKQSLSPMLAAFPYVNGGLFRRSDVEIPLFDEDARNELLDASATFDWSRINPTVFGAIFESTLNPQTRRQRGMHYTSIENIHKVIDPLFLDELRAELDDILKTPVKTRKDRTTLDKRGKTYSRLDEFRKKLAQLTFLDPACGSGNFLTETYLSLRRLENEALRAMYRQQSEQGLQQIMDSQDATSALIRVQISQCHGIEINDFAVAVAQTALWIAESQMMRETEAIVNQQLDFLPLTTVAHIVEGNALRMDWEDVVPKNRLNYIMGNPPFSGARIMSPEQKKDVIDTFGNDWKNAGNLDYVTCWFKKTADFMQRTPIRAAFVATNSISQGESVGALWEPLFNEGVYINFAWPTFRWDSETKSKAHVHVAIIGFSAPLGKANRPVLYGDGGARDVGNINGYLVDAPNIPVRKSRRPLSAPIFMSYGSFALDDGNYTISTQEFKFLIAADVRLEKYLRPFIGSAEFINGKERYCLWLDGANPADIRSIPEVRERVEKVRAWRLRSGRKETVSLADTPTQFAEVRQPNCEYLAVPVICSEKRRYIPIGSMPKETIASNQLFVCPGAGLYELGILTSNVHMAWMRTVAGRLKSDYRYSTSLVYNTFPWPDPTSKQKARIEKTAQAILDARALYPDSSLADLYDELMMPPDLRKAHQENDRAVMMAYGFRKRKSGEMTEPEIVERLMKMYSQLIAEEEERAHQAKAQKKSRKKKG